MAYQYTLHPDAQIEYEESVQWYLKRSFKAASNFVKAVDKGLLHLCKVPDVYINKYKNYHEYTLQKYPFTIVYVIEEKQELIVILAINHQKRKPENKYR
ncbi:type II toxin-antitoxin system RelE/ParE family toxin [Mucilaginibacter sp.]|uniref:type II toxin-antitoxin system RelE/ParE family toxin n=1 Tax=Mucilaginibacter sp. TaxID=1882438 RepID=UPI003D0B2B4D